MKTLIGILFLALLSNSAHSFGGYGKFKPVNNRKGFDIKPDIDSPARTYKSGEKATFSGSICAKKLSIFSSHNGKCHRLKSSNISVRAFFPDMTNEVTGDVTLIQSSNKKEILYNYETPDLLSGSENSFFILVGPIKSELEKLLKIKAKLQKRILHFNKRIDHHVSKGSHELWIKWLTKFRDRLVGLSDRIDILIDQNPDVLVRLKHPLQVDNDIAGSLEKDTVFSGFKMRLKSESGSPIEGESAKITASVTNLTHLSFFFPSFYHESSSGGGDESKDDNSFRKFKMRLKFNGDEIFDSGEQGLGFGETLETEFESEGLSISDFNKLELDLYRTFKTKFFKLKIKSKIGMLTQTLPVSEDNLSPVFSNILPDETVKFVQNFPLLKGVVSDNFGRIDSESLKLTLNGTEDLTERLELTDLDQGRSYSFQSAIEPLDEGIHTISLEAKDFAGNFANPNPIERSIRVDRTEPVVNFDILDNQLTNNPLFNINYTIVDDSPVSSHILHNGEIVYSSDEIVVDFDVTMIEGINTFEIQVVDAAGNIATPLKLNNIELDTVAPILSGITPNNGDIISLLDIDIAGNSNETLLFAKIDDLNLTLGSDQKSFSGTLSVLNEGPKDFTIQVSDLAGNITEVDRSIEVVLKVLNGDLITIVPNGDTGRLIVKGMKFASRPNVEIDVNAGFFNQKIINSKDDGSFMVELDFFNSVKLTATDENIGRTDVVIKEFNVDTTLSGTVLDSIDGNPLPGVIVTITGSSQSAVTDAQGVFMIPDPATGDQIVRFDGVGIPVEVSGPNKKYTHTSVAVSIGRLQTNVIQTPIFMSPLVEDGTETEILEGQDIVVTTPHVPGFSLEVPADSATFPDGGKIGNINAMITSKEMLSVPPLEYAEPETVITLEPSGLTFNEPVKLTLPNTHDFPEGLQVVILSKNSDLGIWEIDGIAKVDIGGNTITTEDGQGITHFSDVYAAPLGMRSKTFSAQDKVGADTFNGAVTTSITMPSYKSLGQDITPSLIYRSTWSNPTIAISDIIDIPRNEVKLSPFVAGGKRTVLYDAEVILENLNSWIEPEYIDAQFYTEDFVSEKFRFTGVPNRSLVSFSMDLQGLESGPKTYNTHYEAQLNQMIVGTRTTRVKSFFGSEITQEPYRETRALEEVYQQDSGGFVFLQNKVNSSAGRGWKIGGVQKIDGVEGVKLQVEEADGKISSYTVNNTIETVQEDTAGMQAVNFSNYPEISYMNNSRQIFQYNDSTKNVENFGSVRANYAVAAGITEYHGTLGQPNRSCFVFRKVGSRSTSYSQILPIDNDTIYTFEKNSVISVSRGDTGSEDLIAGEFLAPKKFNGSFPAWTYWEKINGSLKKVPPPSSYCSSTYGFGCSSNFNFPGASITTQPTPEACWAKTQSALGGSTVIGFKDDSLLSSNFNTFMGVIPGAGQNIIIAADSGNNRVRRIDLDNDSVTTIVGNGQTFDNGDGGLATDASLFHPRGLARDNNGNLFVSTENGIIRRVDTNGFISTYAGKTAANGGILSDVAQAEDMLFNKPYGMVVDNTNGFLYVADTGHHRIVQIDMQTKEAKTVAGSGSCVGGSGVLIGDGKAALVASLCSPEFVGLDDNNNLLIHDRGHNAIRKVILNKTEDGTGVIPKTGTLAFAPTTPDNSEIIRNEDGTFDRLFRDGTVHSFDSKGFHTTSEDRVGRAVQYFYDTNDRLIQQVDPTGSEINYFYSGELLSSIVDPAGRETRFFYNGNELSEVVYPDSTNKKFIYNDGLLVQEFDQRNNKTEYVYNEFKRLESVVRPDLTEIVVNDSTSSTIGNNFTSGNSGSLKSIGTGEGEVVDGIKDAKGNSTQFVKSTNGFVQSIIDADGQLTEVERDSEGRPLKITRPDDTIATFTYDGGTGDLLTRFDEATNVTMTVTYDDFGNVLTESRSNGSFVENTYDANTGLKLSSKNQLNQVSSSTYNNLGLVLTQTNSLSNTVSFEYDEFGNLIAQVDPLLHRTEFERDSAGNVTKVTNAKNQVTQNEYDSFNRLTAVITPKNERTEYTYLPTGELASIKDPLGNMTTFEYDFMGRLTKKTTSLGQVTQLFYDGNGNVIKEIDPAGNVKDFEYDNLDQLTKKVLPDDIIDIAYDVRGNVVEIKNNITQIDFEYIRNDAGDLVSKVTSSGIGTRTDLPTNTLDFDYDDSGNRTQMFTTAGTFTYDYDIGNRLTDVTNHKSEVFSFSYDNGNRLTSITRPGSVSNLSFDKTNFLTSLIHNKGASIISGSEYERDAIGNRTKITTLYGDHDYAYDDNNQVVSGTNPEASSESFSYDPLGNRVTDNNGNYVYDNFSQRLVEDFKYFYFYDDNGNLSSKQEKGIGGEVVQYIHNSSNQLTGVDYYDGVNLLRRVRYSYDALGRRVEKNFEDFQTISNSFTRRYAYDGNEILFEVDGSNTILATYTHSTLRTDDMLSVDITTDGKNAGLATSDSSYFYIKDAQGTVVDITDSSGSVVQHHVYSAFGSLLRLETAAGGDISATPIIDPYFTYTGREFDKETGLYYYRARYYDPGVGRFIQEDPNAGGLTAPITHNTKYVYTNNNPLNLVDPKGELGVILGLLIASTISGLFNIKGEGGFAQGFLQGLAIGVGTVVGAAVFIGAGSLIAGASIAKTGVGIAVGALGGAAGSIGVANTAFGVSGPQLIFVGLGGAFGGGALGKFGFGLGPSKELGKNVAAGANDINAGTVGSIPVEKAPVVKPPVASPPLISPCPAGFTLGISGACINQFQ